MPKAGKCCCCREGAVVPRWQNVTLVRPPGDGHPPSYTVAPYTNPAGQPWNATGDLNALPSRQIDGPTLPPGSFTASPDIGSCALPDSTHVTFDKNCYQLVAGTVNMVQTQRKGGQWTTARKQWHGRLGLVDAENPHVPIGIATVDVSDSIPPSGTPGLNLVFWHQVKYADDDGLTYDDGTTSNFAANFPAGDTQQRFLTEAVQIDYSLVVNGVTNYSSHALNTGTVDRYTGILTHTCAKTVSSGSPAADSSLGRWSLSFFQLVAFFADFALYDYSGFPGLTAFRETKVAPGVYEFRLDSALGANLLLSRVTISFAGLSGATFTRTVYSYNLTTGAVVVTVAETCSVSNENVHYVKTTTSDDGAGNITVETVTEDLTLSAPYTGAQVLSDIQSLFAQWDMSDITLGKLRTDEKLALAPLLCYDEVDARQPEILPWSNYDCTMNDYSLPQIAGQWQKMAWHDPNDYTWIDPEGRFNPQNFPAGGSSLTTGRRTNFAIGHTQAGSDRNFWFGYQKVKRIPVCVSGSVVSHTWVAAGVGDFSPSELPTTTARWMNKQQAQYDPTGDSGKGNLPQDWIRQDGSVVTAGKYVEATIPWPSVNYARPCGWDKFLVSQKSVCCIVGSGAGFFTVKNVSSAAAPLATNGLAVNDYIIAEDFGIYRITGIAAAGLNWTVSVGALLDTLPTGFTMLRRGATARLGRLRYYDAPGITGRTGITTIFAAGTVTITSAVAIPTLRKSSAGTILVDIYDSSMTLLVGSASLTRISDTQWSFAHAAIPTAAYMTGAGVNYLLNTTASQRTGVRLVWTFDQRAAGKPVAYQPNWLGGSGSGTGTGQVGCTSLAISQFTYALDKCRAMVGVVPYYAGVVLDLGDIPPSAPLENFANQTLFAMPDALTFDHHYGATYMGATEMVMPDPFWETPFTPDCDGAVAWLEDDGTGQADAGTTLYYAHRPWVEAAMTATSALPADAPLFYATGSVIAAPYYPNGIPCSQEAGGCSGAEAGGNFISIERPWGFQIAACATIAANGNFATDYAKFTPC